MTILRKTALSIALAAATASVAAAQAPTTSALPFSLGIAGGAAIPTGNLANGASIAQNGLSTGYNITGMVGIPLASSLSLRGEVGYNDFGSKSNGSCFASIGSCNSTVKSIPVTANLVYTLPTTSGIRPYLIGGAGMYHMSQSSNASVSGFSYNSGDNTENDFGWNAGGGIAIPLSGFNAFVEARYNHVSLGQTFGNESASFVPIVFGVSF